MTSATLVSLIRVLIVDDTAAVRLLLQHLLSASGLFAVVGEAGDGRQGIELATSEQPDIILLDLVMPVMDGLQALPGLVSASPRSLIIVLSGFNADSAARQALDLGAHAYIEKKHRPDELLSRIVEIHRTFEFRGLADSNVLLTQLVDLTEKKREQDALPSTADRPDESEAKYRNIIETAGDAFVGVDASGLVTDWNRTAEILFGWSARATLGKRLAHLIIPELFAHPQLDKTISALTAGRTFSGSTRKEMIARHRDGHRFPVEIIIWPAPGFEPGLNAFIHDISDRVGITADQQESERQLTRAQALSEVGSWEWDVAAEVVTWSDEMHRICGVTPGEFGGSYAAHLELVHPDDRLLVEVAIARAVAAGEAFENEARIVRPDGSIRWLHTRCDVESGDGGNPPRLYGTCQDVTERKANDDGMRLLASEGATTNAELTRSNDDLSQFAAVAAHDLKSPLHVVLGFSELLARQYGDRLGDDGRKLVGSITAGAQRMDELIEDLLVYCRLGAAELCNTAVDLDDVLARTLAILGPDIESRKAQVTTDVLPVFNGDPVQLQNLMQNLLANALKFSGKDAVPRIHIGAERIGDDWCLSVSDNGIGIDASKRERIFGMFVRLHSQDQYGGTGIGLAICKRIVERHGGRIRVEENPGGGSRFVVTLPDVLMTAVIANPVIDDAARQAFRPLDILLVEDSPEHAELIAALLAQAPTPGYNLSHVGSVAGALEALTTTEVDCVLLDLTLPDACDLEAVTQVRSAAPIMPVVVITSSSDESLAFAAVREGAQDYLVKGHIDVEHLSRSIRWAVQRKALETELARDALHDVLTKLPNRTLMLDRLRSALARTERSGTKVGVFYLDLNDFKPVNDRLGHDAGDRVLIVIADRLSKAVRPQDTVARIGGDEFVVICEGFGGVDPEWDIIRARLSSAVANPIMLGQQKLQVTACIGLSVGGRGQDPEYMLRDADQAMYRSKRSRL